METKQQKASQKVVKQQKADGNAPEVEQANPVTEVMEEVIQDMENAIAGMNIAIAKLIEQGNGITRVVSQRQAATSIIKALKSYVE